MKILVYGEAMVLGSGAWCYAETLREMGHEVLEHSDRDGLDRYVKSIPLRMYRNLVGNPLPWHRRKHGSSLVATVRRERPGLVLVLKGLNVSVDDVEAMRAAGAFVTIVNHDDFFSRSRSNRSPVQRKAIRAYDQVLTTREVNVDEIRPLNDNVEFFPFAYYPRIHRPVQVSPGERSQWECDVTFVGTWEPVRARQLEELVERLPARYAIWGNSWERLSRSSPLRKFVRFREVVMDDMAKAIGAAKIALAFLRRANRDEYTQRSFEIPACGGVLLAERTAQHLRYFREGIEAEFFDAGDTDELVGAIGHLLTSDERRERVRRAGMEALARQRHTYRDRLERLLELYRTRTGSAGE